MASEENLLNKINEAIYIAIERQYLWSDIQSAEKTREYVMTTLVANSLYEYLQYPKCVMIETSVIKTAKNVGLAKDSDLTTGNIDILINNEVGAPRGIIELKRAIVKPASFKGDHLRVDRFLHRRSSLSFGVLGGNFIKKFNKPITDNFEEYILKGLDDLKSQLQPMLANTKVVEIFYSSKDIVPLGNHDKAEYTKLECPISILLKKK